MVDFSLDARDFGVDAAADDNRTALQAAIDAAWESPFRRLMLPVGAFKISGPVDISGISLIGTGPVSGCALVVTTPNSQGVTIAGHRNGVHVPGGSLSDMGIFALAGIQGGNAIHIGGSSLLPDRFNLERLRITTHGVTPTGVHGTWASAIWASGAGRTSPPGIRGATIRDVEFFNVKAPGIVLHGITNLRMEGVQGFTGQGVQALTGIWVGGTPAVNSDDVQVSDCRVDGPLNVTNCRYSGFEGRFWGGTQTDGSAVGCVFSTN